MIILRLHNNLRWALSVDAESDMTRVRTGSPLDNTVAVNYEFEDTSYRAGRMRFRELTPGQKVDQPAAKSPLIRGRNYLAFDLSQVVWIQPGHSIRFMAQPEHLQFNFAISIHYTYDWEGKGDYSNHPIFFYASDLPTDATTKVGP